MSTPAPHRNSVVLAGRITAEPALREISSGQTIARWRVAVNRPRDERGGRAKVDPVSCVSFDATVQAAVRDWRLGDTVEVSGALRRRFWRGDTGPVSTFEVEAHTVELLAANPTPADRRKDKPAESAAT